jgi:uncharacterized protein (TIGR00369 family)
LYAEDLVCFSDPCKSVAGFGTYNVQVQAFEHKVRESFSRQALMTTIGARLLSVERGAVEIAMPFDRKLTQQNDFLHAGVITSILDSACGYAALTVAPEKGEVLSVEFKVNLLAPAVGESFVARAQVKRAGRTLTVCTADAFALNQGNEKLVATMQATIMNMIPQA